VYEDLDYNVMAHAQTTFCVWVERTNPYFLTADMRGREFSSLMAAGFCVGVAHNGITSVFCFPFTSLPSRMFVPSHSNRTPRVKYSCDRPFPLHDFTYSEKRPLHVFPPPLLVTSAQLWRIQDCRTKRGSTGRLYITEVEN
jgi:hypothetical protein